MRAIALLIFIFSSMHTAHLRARDPDDIAFPMSMSVDGVVASEQCKGLTYCAVQPPYPQKLFDEMFRDTMNVSLSLKPQDGDERNWGESRKLSGSYKIVNRRTRPTANKGATEGGPFVFPGVSSRIGEAKEIQVPEECQKTGICEDLPDYPEDVVRSLVDDLIQRNLTTIFNNDVLFPPQLAERFTADDIDIELCTSKIRIFTPRAAKTVDANWHYILNPKDNKPKQTFRVEICTSGDSPCSNNKPPIMSIQTGYTSYCEQKYSLREMFALDSNHQLIKDTFQVPTCCSCLLKQL